MLKIEEVTKFVEKHTEEQCGLDVAQFEVYDSFGQLQISVCAKKHKRIKSMKKGSNKGMRFEWKDQALDLIDEIGLDPNAGTGGLGIKFELNHVSDYSFFLKEIK